MKKLFYLLAVLPLFVACTSDDEGSIVIVKNDKPSTQVFAQGALLDYTSTKADYNPNKDYGYGVGVWPNDQSAEGYAVAKFSIRIDASFPGVIDQKVALYWSTKGGPNLGKVYTDFPWGTYNDRDMDYYKVDQKTGKNIGMFRYALDPFGTKVNPALKEVPDMKAYCEWLLARKDTQYKNELQGIVDNWDKYELVWYVAKEVGGQNFWHVNGYFKLKDHTPEDIWEIIEDETDDMEIKENNVEDNVEIDIHKQEHKDWNEIKTSIHIRTDAESIKINIPIKYENIVEADDFAIRIYDYYISGIQIQNMITHDENGITIEIKNINPTVIERLKSQFGDGLTIEIHSYCVSEEGVWAAMKNTTITTGKTCELKYQITSAAETEKDWIIYPTPTE